MTYKEAKDFLETKGSQGIMLGLDRMKCLMSHLDNPQKHLKIIHVAGTNGKGSVSAYISGVLSEAGYLVGRYVSPVVFHEDEFVLFQDKEEIYAIDRITFKRLVEKITFAVDIMEKAGKEKPTEFEMETALALLAFKEKNCDFVILEAGLGGASDATNIIESPIVEVITPISMDHMHMLGKTIEEIAENKAGIIKNESTVVTKQYDLRAYEVLKKRSEAISSKLIDVGKPMITCINMQGIDFLYENNLYFTKMLAKYQVINASIAIQTCDFLSQSYDISKEDIIEGIKKTTWAGRFQLLSANPPIVIDGAHNINGIKHLKDSLLCQFKGYEFHAVVGVFKDKEYKKMVGEIADILTSVICIKPPTQRGLDNSILMNEFKGHNVEAAALSSIEEAISIQKSKCINGEKKAVVVFGSLSILAKARFGG